jgi:hemin uptake protein HemP
LHGRDDDAPRGNDPSGAAGAGETQKVGGAQTAAPADARVLDSSELFGGRRQVVIGHNGCRYVLRITKHGKLILNK